jgi:hypothetical protein
MKICTPRSALTLTLFASAGMLQGQSLFDTYDFVRTAVTFSTVAAFAPDNAVDFEATGNTISAANFTSRVATAHAGGYGGVISFENATVVNTGVNTAIPNETWTGSAWVARTNLRAQTLNAVLGASGPTVSINRGSAWYVEAGGAANLGTAAGPGTASLGDNNINGEWFFEFGQSPAQRMPTSGTNVLGGPTTWDFSFNAADMIVAVGTVYLGRDNFQWYSQGGADTRLFAQVTFSDNSTATSEHLLLQQAAGLHDVFVGFEAPSGLYITEFHIWHRGNNNRPFGSIDDIGIIAIPEPSTYALWAGLMVMAGIVWQRRRRKNG